MFYPNNEYIATNTKPEISLYRVSEHPCISLTKRYKMQIVSENTHR